MCRKRKIENLLVVEGVEIIGKEREPSKRREDKVQCEFKHFTPLRFSGNFFTKAGNFQMKFYSPILCSYLCYTTKFCSFVSNFDKVMPY